MYVYLRSKIMSLYNICLRLQNNNYEFITLAYKLIRLTENNV